MDRWPGELRSSLRSGAGLSFPLCYPGGRFTRWTSLLCESKCLGRWSRPVTCLRRFCDGLLDGAPLTWGWVRSRRTWGRLSGILGVSGARMWWRVRSARGVCACFSGVLEGDVGVFLLWVIPVWAGSRWRYGRSLACFSRLPR